MTLLVGTGAEARPERAVAGMEAAGQPAGVGETGEDGGPGSQRGGPGRGRQGTDPVRGDPSGCRVLYPECVKPCELCHS